MSKEDGVVFGFSGLVTWMAATAFYLAFGASLLEAAFWFYGLSAVLAGLAVIFVFRSVARLRRIPRGRRLTPALAFAAPGLICATTTMINFAALAGPGAQPASVGRYGAFLLFGYAAMTAAAMERSRGPSRQGA